MKYILTVALVFFISCHSQKVFKNQNFLERKIFKSKKGHLFGENIFVFNPDSTFEFVGQGPAVFISKGVWKYDYNTKAIILNSDKIKIITPKSIDTLWRQFDQKKIQVLNKRKISMDDIYYYSE